MKKGLLFKIIICVSVCLICILLRSFELSNFSLDEKVQYVKTNCISDLNGRNYLFSNKEELNEYLISNKSIQYNDLDTEFINSIKNYDDQFFKNKNLLFILLTETSGSIKHKVNSVKMKMTTNCGQFL